MILSLKKALGTPFSLGLFLMALAMALPYMVIYYNIHNWQINNFFIFYTSFALLYILCMTYMFGYMTIYGHSIINNKLPFRPFLNLNFLKISCRGLLFALSVLIFNITFILLFVLFFKALFAFSTHSSLLIIIIPSVIFGGLFYLFYLMTAWARFMDTFRPLTIFHFATNLLFIKRYWTKLIRVILYLLGIIVILFIPLLIIEIVGQLIIKMDTRSVYFYFYLHSLIQAYLILININVLAQAYGWIKGNEINAIKPDLDVSEEDPVIMENIVVLNDVAKAPLKSTKKVSVSTKKSTSKKQQKK